MTWPTFYRRFKTLYGNTTKEDLKIVRQMVEDELLCGGCPTKETRYTEAGWRLKKAQMNRTMSLREERERIKARKKIITESRRKSLPF